MRFEDLARLDSDELAEVFQAAGRELTALALLGAGEELVARVASRLSAPEADWLSEQLEHPRPVRLREVEDARRQIAQLAQHLAFQSRHRGVKAAA
jgi:flagellar motor switch protein FliG